MEKIFAQGLTLPGGYRDPQSGNWIDSTNQVNGPAGTFTSLGMFMTRIIPYIFLFAGVAFLFMIITGGFALLTGANDPKQLEAGKEKIMYGIIGFIIIFCAFWIVQIVARIFGLTEFIAIFG